MPPNYSKWVGRGLDKISIRRNYKTGTATINFQGQKFRVGIDFLEERLNLIDQYQSKERFFNSFYYGTDEGRREVEERYIENFSNAMTYKYMYADESVSEYAKDLWRIMSNQQRDRFSWLNRDLIGEVFNYDDRSILDKRRNFDYDQTHTEEQDTADVWYLVRQLEQFVPRQTVNRLREEYGL